MDDNTRGSPIASVKESKVRQWKAVPCFVMFISVIVATLPAESKGKILVIVRESSEKLEFMLRMEVLPILKTLADAGYTATTATDTGGMLKAGEIKFIPDISLGKVAIKEYRGVVIPCMAASMITKAVRMPPLALEIIAGAGKLGLPIAAEDCGVELLDKAGVLAGKRFTIDPVLLTVAPSGIYQDKGVVRDGSLVTSRVCPFVELYYGTPTTMPEMMSVFISMLESGKKP